MYAIEFEANIENGIVRIPEQYERLKNSHAKVVVMVDENVAEAADEVGLDFSGCVIHSFEGQDGLQVQRTMRDDW
ncbi:hypothetical protein C8D92_108157 [Tamilnaduibacter salinus]|uniref:Uncharacterized protein n=1 Tax=Tamilnaduibacter salinus TaxID=1484056 RepID=A0A2U1CUS7_9GAMM|nr:hypothetical protein [Tamilnaduibacter salinus]PVY70800.1 hypothetical protein C8D92_108157 [Tamilnaduibacter salinus]